MLERDHFQEGGRRSQRPRWRCRKVIGHLQPGVRVSELHSWSCAAAAEALVALGLLGWSRRHPDTHRRYYPHSLGEPPLLFWAPTPLPPLTTAVPLLRHVVALSLILLNGRSPRP